MYNIQSPSLACPGVPLVCLRRPKGRCPLGIPTTFKKVDETSVPAPQKAARQAMAAFPFLPIQAPTPSPLARVVLFRIV